MIASVGPNQSAINPDQVAGTLADPHAKTYDFFYKADNFDPVFNEKLEFDLGIDVQDALRAALKEFNKLIK